MIGQNTPEPTSGFKKVPNRSIPIDLNVPIDK